MCGSRPADSPWPPWRGPRRSALFILAMIGFVDIGQCLQQSCLARSVRSDRANTIPLENFKADIRYSVNLLRLSFSQQKPVLVLAHHTAQRVAGCIEKRVIQIKAEKSLIRAHRKPKKTVAKQVFRKIRKSPAGNLNKAERFGV